MGMFSEVFKILIDIFKNGYGAILAIVGFLIFYKILNFLFGKKENDDDNEEENENKKINDEENPLFKLNMSKNKKGYTSSFQTITTGVDHDRYIPKDGTIIHEGNFNRKRTIHDKSVKNVKQINELKIKEYEKIFYQKHVTDLNIVGKMMHCSNDDVAKDIKDFKKKGLFSDLKIDTINETVFYVNDTLNRNEEIYYLEEEKKEIKKEDPNKIIQKTCKYCQTTNLVNSGDKTFRCYYCLKEN